MDEADGRSIVFDVDRGPRGSKVSLAFEGNDALGARELASALPEPGSRAFFTLLERPAELERGLRLRYAAEGHLDATAGEPQTSFDPAEGTLHVVVPIVEGRPTPIRSVTVTGAEAVSEPAALEALGIEVGAPVDFPAIREGQSRLRTRYRGDGFPDVHVRAQLERGAEGLDVRVMVEEGERSVVGSVRILGNQRTRAAVIENQLTFGARDPVRIIDFQETQKRLYDLGIFRSADVRTDPSQQGLPVQDVIVQVVERADLDVNYGLRYNVLTSEQSVDRETEPRSQGLEAVARLNLINQLGRGTNLGFSIFYQGRYRLFRTTFRLPTFFGRRLITELSADTERETDALGIMGFETRGESFTFQQSKKLTDDRYEKFSLQWNVRQSRFRGARFDENEDLVEVSTRRTRFGVSLVEDRRDSFANPTRGRLWNVTLQAVPEAWGSDVGYVRVFGQYFHYQPLWRSLVWAAGARLGFVSGTKELILIEDRFLSGGANSVRGFQQNTLGPSVVVPETGERIWVGGQAVGVFNQELRFPLYKALHGGVFWDAGNVFTTASAFTLTDLRHSLGAGLRVVLPFGALSFDFVEALNAQMNDETVWFHFAFGYAF